MAEEKHLDFDEAYRQFKVAVGNQNVAEIMVLISRIQRQSPDDANLMALAQVFSGYPSYFQGDHQTARQIWTALEDREFTSEVPALAAGESLLRINEAEAALQSFAWAAEIDPTNGENWIRISQLRQSLGQIDAAAEAAAEATLAAPKDPVAHNQLGPFLMILGKLEDAASALENACVISPNSGPYAINLANFYRQHRSSQEALELANRYLDKDPHIPAFLSLKGEMLLRMNEVEKATRVLELAAELNPTHPEILKLQVEAMRMQQRIARADSQSRTPHQLAEVYDDLISRDKAELDRLIASAHDPTRALSWLIPLIWLLLFVLFALINFYSAVYYLICDTLTCYLPRPDSLNLNWVVLLSSTLLSSLTTSLLVFPSLLKLRKNHNDQKMFRLGIEDYTRKQLLLNFVAVYNQRPAEKEDAIQLGLQHFNERGNAEEISLKANEQRFKYSRHGKGIPSKRSINALAKSLKYLGSAIRRQ